MMIVQSISWLVFSFILPLQDTEDEPKTKQLNSKRSDLTVLLVSCENVEQNQPLLWKFGNLEN